MNLVFWLIQIVWEQDLEIFNYFIGQTKTF